MATHTDESGDKVVGVKVVRRNLLWKWCMPSTWWVAHSALLVKTADEKTHLVEYMADGKVHVYRDMQCQPAKTLFGKQSKTEVSISGCDSADTNGTWKSQQLWHAPNHAKTNASLSAVVEGMQAKANSRNNGEYSLFTNNCHMAQEDARREVLGMAVVKPYGLSDMDQAIRNKINAQAESFLANCNERTKEKVRPVMEELMRLQLQRRMEVEKETQQRELADDAEEQEKRRVEDEAKELAEVLNKFEEAETVALQAWEAHETEAKKKEEEAALGLQQQLEAKQRGEQKSDEGDREDDEADDFMQAANVAAGLAAMLLAAASLLASNPATAAGAAAAGAMAVKFQAFAAVCRGASMIHNARAQSAHAASTSYHRDSDEKGAAASIASAERFEAEQRSGASATEARDARNGANRARSDLNAATV